MIPLATYSATVTTVNAVLLADTARSASVPLLQRLDPAQRVSVIAGLVVILTFGGLLLLLVRTGGRLTRWYIDQPMCRSHPGGSSCSNVGRDAERAAERTPPAGPTQPQERVGADQSTRPISSRDTLSQ